MAKTFHLTGPEDLEAIDGRIKKTKDLRDKQRLRAIRYGLLGAHTMQEIAGKVGVSRATVGSWSKTFREKGIAAVLRTEFDQRGRKGKVDATVQEQLKKELAVGRFKRAKEVRAWLENEHGIEMGLNGVYYWLGKSGGVLKVPRKTHARQDAVKTQAFKTELAERLRELKLAPGSKVRIWVADEHRYGLISVIRKVWTLRGHKPTAPYQSKYQWGHLYAALEVGQENSSEFFFSPTVNLEASDAFLRQIAKSDEIAEHVVIWDGAGFHQKPGSHPIPERIHLIQLPAYSPELNPVERLFDQLKDEVGNRLFHSLDDIEAAIVCLLRSFWENTHFVSSLIGQGWLLDRAKSSSTRYRLVIS